MSTAHRESLDWAAVKSYFPNHKVSTLIRPLPDRRVIYVKNAKAGCSTILVWLDRIHTGEHDAVFTDVHRQHRLPTLAEVGRETMLRMLAGDAYRFTFVRNPLSRIESAYWDKIVHNVAPNVIATLGIDPDSLPIPFERFLSLIEDHDQLSLEPHTRAQHFNLMHPLVQYDYIGKLESFAADLEHVRRAAGLPRVGYQVHNTTKHAGDSVYDGRPDLVRRVEQLYATDFETYGY